MKYIIRGRDTGKAKEMLEYARKHNALVVTENKRAFRVKANSLGYNDVEIIDYEDLSNEEYDTMKTQLVIHNLDKWAKEIFMNTYSLNVIGFTATEE